MIAAAKSQGQWARTAGALAGLAVVALLMWWLIGMFTAPAPSHKKRVIQEISLVKPPPPPPPKVEPQKVEPQKVEIKQPLEAPKPDQQANKPDAPPPGPDLGLDAKGGPGGDSFGLVGKKGGADLIGSGTIGGGGAVGGTNRFAWYGALVKDRIQDAVAKDKKLNGVDYRVNVNVWINPSGMVIRAELLGSTGNAEVDNGLRLALRNLPPLREGAPSDMPQPIKLRITAS